MLLGQETTRHNDYIIVRSIVGNDYPKPGMQIRWWFDYIPLPASEPPSKQNFPSTTPNLRRCWRGQWPASLGGTPVAMQKDPFCKWSLAGPQLSLLLDGIRVIWIKNCWTAKETIIHRTFKRHANADSMFNVPSGVRLRMFTCHWIKVSRESNAIRTVISEQMMARVLLSLSRVKAVSMARKPAKEIDLEWNRSLSEEREEVLSRSFFPPEHVT